MRLAKLHLSRFERGDTIIEVLIAMAVAGSVLSITYSVMNKNLLISRSNQERTEASKIVQGQLETLRSLSVTPDGLTKLAAENSATRAFCFGTGSQVIYRQTTITGPDASGNASFTVDAHCQTGPDNRYNYVIANDASAPDRKLYRIFIVWDSVLGGRDNISMSYRI